VVNYLRRFHDDRQFEIRVAFVGILLEVDGEEVGIVATCKIARFINASLCLFEGSMLLT